MIVCGHGDVAAYCKDHDMVVCETWSGEIDNYKGSSRVLVTDKEMSENEYYYLKGKLLGRGIELISTRYKDDKLLTEFLAYQANRRKPKNGGRHPFGFYRRNGVLVENPAMIKVARKIIELRDAGRTLRQIQINPEIRHADGRQISISTIHVIVQNRGMYEK